MKKSTTTQWILVILLFISYQFAYNAQTLDASFSSPLTTQCSGDLFTLNTTNSSYQSYSWTITGPNAFTSNLSGSTASLNLTEAGTYNVSLTVSDGISTETNMVNDFLTVDAPPIANAGVDQTICANSFATLNGSFGGSATSIIWTGGTGTFSPNVTNLTATYTPSLSEIANGFVNLILRTNDPAGPCSAVDDTVMIIINQVPTVNAPTSLCVGSTAQLSPSSGGTWTSSNAVRATINPISGLATGVSPGNVTFIFTSNATNCSNNTSTIAVNPLPTVTLSANTVCVNGTVQVTPNFGGTWNTYNSSVASVTSSGLVTGLAQGTVNFTFTNTSTGCAGTTNNLTVNPLPTLDPIPDQTVCAGQSTTPIIFSGSNPNNIYNWTHSNQAIGLATLNGTGDIPSFQAQNNSSFPLISTFTVMPSLNGCLGTSINFTITVTQSPTINPIPNQIVCAGESITPITFSGSAQQYNWTNDNTSIGLAASGIGNISGFTTINNTLNNQVATITVTPISSGCNVTPTTFTITVMPLPTVFASPDQTVCNNDNTIPVNFSGAINTSVYNWNGSINIGMLPMSGTGNIPAFPAFNGSQTTIIDSIIVTPSLNSCVGVSDTFLIIVKPISTVFSVSDQTVCAGESTSPIAFSGSNLNTVYYWTLDNTSIGIVSSGTGNIPAFQAQNTTSNIQTTNIIVTPNLNGCIWVSDTFSVTVNPLPIINAGNDITLCYGATFTPIATGTAITISWNNGVVQGTSFTPTVTETYIATGTNMYCYDSDSITVTVNALPQLTISAFDGEDSLACDGTLSALVTNGTTPYSYTWTNGVSNYTTSAIQDLCSGTYSLSVVDANGCSSNISAIINDTLIQNVLGDTLIFTDNIYLDSTIIGADTSAWIENCTFDYSLVTGATIDSYVDSGDSTIVTWQVALSNGSTVSVDATYYMSPGTTGVYDLTLQLYCSAKSGPKFVVASSRLYYETSTIGVQSLSLNSVFLYPNPTSSTLSISGINSEFSYQIFDLQGKKLKQGANDKQIEIENLPAGTYVIGISTDNEVKQLRFVKL